MNGGTTAERGLWGEQQAARYLEQQGYHIVAKRWRCRFGELDLIVEKEAYLCFVEVKLRQDDKIAPARAFVTPSKQKKLRLAAELYLMEHPTQLQPRLDVAEVYAPDGIQTKKASILYWENAF